MLLRTNSLYPAAGKCFKYFFSGMFRFTVAALLLLVFTCHTSLSQVKKFTILSTSDEHSTLMPLPLSDYHPENPGSAVGGYARLSTLVKQVREEKADEPVLLFSSGDILGGTPFAWLALEGFSAEIALMHKIGYDAMTIGNHEFDYGPEVLADYMIRAGYPEFNDHIALIASNLVIPEGHKLHEPGIMENRLFKLENGINVGVFGLLGKQAYSYASFAEPVTAGDQHETALRQVNLLKESGADIILALTHSGIEEDRELALAVDGIDIILGGHDHYVTESPEIVNNTLIFHPGYYLQYLGRLDLEWNSTTGELTPVNDLKGSPYLLKLDHAVAEDPDVLEITDSYLSHLNEFVSVHTGGEFSDVSVPVLYSDFQLDRPEPFTETTVGNFVTDAMRLMASRITGDRVDIAIQGNGIIRADITPGSMELSTGEVSLFDLVTVSGLGSGPDGKAGYPLVSFYITEKEILNVLETISLLSQLMGDAYFQQISGIRYTYDPGKATWLTIPVAGIPVPAYRSVQSAELYTGQGIQDDDNYVMLDGSGDRLYHVVTDYYLTTFLPMIGDILPKLKIELKDKAGLPVSPEDAIITYQGVEYKVWESLAHYAVSFEKNNSGLPVMPDYYRNTHDRIIKDDGIPLKVWSYIAIIILVVILVYLARLATRSIKYLIVKRQNRQA
jgi:5'-nucleotidase / UDP-sugar diphosphatase